MENGWRPQTTVAIASFALIPLWMLALTTLKGTGGTDELAIAMVAPCLIFTVGFGSSIAGVRRGSRASRMASRICLFLWVILLVTLALFLFWLSKQRFA
jgi:uncharacterized membrane protein